MTRKLLIGATAVFGLALSAGQALAQNVSIKFSSWLPQSHFTNTQIFAGWFKEIEAATEGRVTVEVLPKTVGTAQTTYDVIRDGLADSSLVVAAYTPGRFVLAEMFDLPLLGNDPSTMSVIAERTYRKHFLVKGEFVGTKIMMIFNITPLQIFTNKKPVVSFEDLKGLKLRSPNKTTTTILNAAGAVPILKSSAEVYEMLSTGAIDGQLTQADTVIQSNSAPLMKFVTLVPGGLANSTLVIPMNPDTWAKISKKDQEAIEKLTFEKYAQKFGDLYGSFEVTGMKKLVDAGYKVTEAGPALMNALAPTMKSIDEDWIKRAKDKGIADPAAILTEFRAEIAKASKK